jgi:hypothetical protein
LCAHTEQDILGLAKLKILGDKLKKKKGRRGGRGKHVQVRQGIFMGIEIPCRCLQSASNDHVTLLTASTESLAFPSRGTHLTVD